MKNTFVGAAAALIMIASATTAMASLDFGDPVDVTGKSGPEFGNPIWGSSGAPVPGFDNGNPHSFGGTSIFADPFFTSATVTVTSGIIEDLPPQKKFGGWVSLNFSNFFPGDFTNHEVTIGPIKDPDEGNFINDVWVEGVGNASHDGLSISWSGLGADLAVAPVVTIFWTQVPAPGALALLGLAGLAGARRRRA